MDYQKIVVALIEHFIASEGTDYLARQGHIEDGATFRDLTEIERAELSRLRDIARKNVKWSGY